MLTVLYVASFGPVCRIVRPTDLERIHQLAWFYGPLFRVAGHLAPAEAWRQARWWYAGETGRLVFIQHVVNLLRNDLHHRP